MDPLRRVEAAALRLALGVSIVNIGDVIAWADAVITGEDQPEYSVIELALMGDRSREIVAAQLAAIAADADELSAIRCVLAILRDRLDEPDVYPWTIARKLYALSRSVVWPEHVLGDEANWLDDLFDHSPYDRALAELREYLALHGSSAPLR